MKGLGEKGWGKGGVMREEEGGMGEGGEKRKKGGGKGEGRMWKDERQG